MPTDFGASLSAGNSSANESFSSGEAGAPVLPCSNDTKRAWIEFELLDCSTSEPLANEDYEVRAPDGAITRGKLDGSGAARLDGIEPGMYTILFPNFDASAMCVPSQTTKYPPSAVKALNWIEIELLDELDRPVPDESYAITLADGSVREGKTDANGRARIESIPDNVGTVVFPAFDKKILTRL